jgi:hypothetical protein
MYIISGKVMVKVLYSISKEYNLEIATKKTKLFGSLFITEAIRLHIAKSSTKILYQVNNYKHDNGTFNKLDTQYHCVTTTLIQTEAVSPVLFNLYLDEVIRIWSQKLKTSKYFKKLIFNTLLFADGQFTISETADNLQKAVYLLYGISKEHNLEIATKKDEGICFRWGRSIKNKNYYKR